MTSVSGVAVSLTAVRVCLLLLGSAIVANAAPTAPGKPRFHDSFESTAAVAAGKEGGPGRRLSGPVTLGEGKDAEGAKLAGVAQIRYEPVTDILDPSGGELEFRVKLHFDPTESNQRTRTVLRNQIFASFWDTKRGYTNVSVYNAGRETYAVCVMNAARNIVFYRAFSAVWRRGEWHRLKLTWGRELSLWCDGEKKVGGPFHGLFGPVTFDPATTVLYLGTQIGYSNIESQFTIADLTIRGPAGDQVTRRPRITLPLLRGAAARRPPGRAVLAGRLPRSGVPPLSDRRARRTATVSPGRLHGRRIVVGDRDDVAGGHCAAGGSQGARFAHLHGGHSRVLPATGNHACRRFLPVHGQRDRHPL